MKTFAVNFNYYAGNITLFSKKGKTLESGSYDQILAKQEDSISRIAADPKSFCKRCFSAYKAYHLDGIYKPVEIPLEATSEGIAVGNIGFLWKHYQGYTIKYYAGTMCETNGTEFLDSKRPYAQIIFSTKHNPRLMVEGAAGSILNLHERFLVLCFGMSPQLAINHARKVKNGSMY